MIPTRLANVLGSQLLQYLMRHGAGAVYETAFFRQQLFYPSRSLNHVFLPEISYFTEGTPSHSDKCRQSVAREIIPLFRISQFVQPLFNVIIVHGPYDYGSNV